MNKRKSYIQSNIESHETNEFDSTYNSNKDESKE